MRLECFRIEVSNYLSLSWLVHYLWGEPFGPIAGIAKEPVNTPVLAIGVFLIFIGLFAFFAVLMRLA